MATIPTILTDGNGHWFQLTVNSSGILETVSIPAPEGTGTTTGVGGNSSITLQLIADEASSIGEIAPALATSGYSDMPALSIANDVMTAMILGGPGGQPLNWKWNRFNVTPFCTNQYQQDYFVAGVVNLGWLENCFATNINQVTVSKQKGTLEVKRDLDVVYMTGGYPSKICWLPNDQLQTATWGQHPYGPTSGNPTGENNYLSQSLSLQNPGPGVIYTNPVGQIQSPTNAGTCVVDAFGNLWVLTTYGTCGESNPFTTASVQYPTPSNPTQTATTVTDGSCVWTAVNPKGQGFRINVCPASNSVVWQINPIGQMRPVRFTQLTQTLDPIPDDYSTYFKQGFVAECYRRNPDQKVRAKYAQERQIWMNALDMALRQGQREEDDYGFYPGSPVMDSGYGFVADRPDRPWGFNGW